MTSTSLLDDDDDVVDDGEEDEAGTFCDIEEIVGDVLSIARTGASVVHCISSDCALGDGIAKQLDVAYGIKRDLMQMHKGLLGVGNVVELRRVTDEGSMISIFNVVTKSSKIERPSYESLDLGLVRLRSIIDEYTKPGCGREVPLIAMPRIGCGIDGLQWEKVRELILSRFSGCMIPLKVCVLPTK